MASRLRCIAGLLGALVAGLRRRRLSTLARAPGRRTARSQAPLGLPFPFPFPHQDFDTVKATNPPTGTIHRPYMKTAEDSEAHVAPGKRNPHTVAAALAMVAGVGGGHGEGGGGAE